MKDALLTFDEYIAFKEFVIDDLEEFEEKVMHYGVLSRRKFNKIIKKLIYDNHFKLTEQQIDILFEILDIDGDGRIDQNEYLNVLKNAKKLGRDVHKDVSEFLFTSDLQIMKHKV